MSTRYSLHDLKLAVLDAYSKTRKEHRRNMIGRRSHTGSLEYYISTTFTDDERSLAGKAVEELRRDGFLRSTDSDMADPESWLEITEPGRQALARRALDELDAALSDIDPAFLDLRHGATAALTSGSPDALRQAAHSGRELIRQVLDKLAPGEAITANGDVTRKARIRHTIKTRRGSTSNSDTETIEALCNVIDTLYGKLSAEAHREAAGERRDVTDLLQMTDTALRRLLCSGPL